jgi:hypothetical protein
MSLSKLGGLVLCGSFALACLQAQPALAQNKPKAADQLKKANEGAKARDHTFDGRKAPANAVRANTAPKQNPVGQPIVSTRNNPGYKPAQPKMKPVNVPSPTVARSTTTATSSSAPKTTAPATAPQKKK